MTFSRWVIRSLVHYRYLHLAVGLAAAVATAALTGALVVGDCVRETLRYAMSSRLGQVDAVVATQERFFTEDLSRRLGKAGVESAPLLQMRGILARGDGSIRVNQVHILGVDDRFFQLSPAGETPNTFADLGAMVNERLAARLQLNTGKATQVVVRVDTPGALSRDLALAPIANRTTAARLPVLGVADDAHFGRFGLEANQQVPLNLFVPLAWLQRHLDRSAQVNLLLIKAAPGASSQETLTRALQQAWRLADAEAGLGSLGERSGFELRSTRVFLDSQLSQAALAAHPQALPLITYFVNELRLGNAATPYSMVTAVGAGRAFTDILPADMGDDDIVINQWLADDLQAGVGDTLTLTYYLPSGRRPLQEAQQAFRIRRVVPLKGAPADPSLMPDFPGLVDAESCSEWDPGLPIDLKRVRDKDEVYWDAYRGTPKAFVTLAAGRAMWANRYGDLTAVRFPATAGDAHALAEGLRMQMDPASLGLFARPVRSLGNQARTGGTDFGQLFLGLSMFLIASGILLTGLLFVFAVEGRRTQTGMLMAIGFPPRRIRRLYLTEGGLVALLGALAGTCLGLVYTRLLIHGLATAWQGAVAGTTIRYAASFQSQCIGLAAGFAVAFLAMVWTLRRQMSGSAHNLLTGNESLALFGLAVARRRWTGWLTSMLSLAGALLLVAIGPTLTSGAMSGAFFGAGALLLIALLTWTGMGLRRLGVQHHKAARSLPLLALRSSARRRGRSLAVVAMLACGVFVVTAVGANRKDPADMAEKRASGTGGFALYAVSSVPVLQDLNTQAGREAWGLDAAILDKTRFVALRVRDGDDASCLNLNRAQTPRIMGVAVDELADRGAFAFQRLMQTEQEYAERPWDLLQQDLGDAVIPAIGDYPTVFWGLGKTIGDDLIYRSRDGNKIHLRIVAMMASSMLQGNLIIAETAMRRYFPEAEGYRAWLIDAPSHMQAEVSAHLTQRLADAGLSVETAVGRLMAFAQVENTYLSIFLVLGGLGLVLGCAGLGLVVVRNLLERQGELAMMRAMGFGRRILVKMACWEHASLLGAGLLTGLICAMIAVAPALHATSGQLPFGLLLILMLMIGSSGALWVVAATRFALRGDILTPLRNE